MSIDIHPAILAAHHSWRCVQARAREQWLELDGRRRDDRGPGRDRPDQSDRQGLPRPARGRAVLGQPPRADRRASRSQAHESFAAGNESAHVLTLTTMFPNGVKMSVHGIFTYTVNDEHKIKALRGFWSMDEAKIEKPAAMMTRRRSIPSRSSTSASASGPRRCCSPRSSSACSPSSRRRRARATSSAPRSKIHPRGVDRSVRRAGRAGLPRARGRRRARDLLATRALTDHFLDRAKPRYVGGILEMLEARLYRFWGDLTEALRTGKPQNEIKHTRRADVRRRCTATRRGSSSS